MLKDNLRTRERARLCGKLKLLLSELSLRADHYVVCVSAICFCEFTSIKSVKIFHL